MPRSLRWHNLWHRWKFRMYGVCAICILGLVLSVVYCISAYKAYHAELNLVQELLQDERVHRVQADYNTLMKTRDTYMLRKNDMYTLPLVVYILDAAMEHGMTLNTLDIKKSNIALDGVGHNEESCRAFLSSIKHRLRGIECHGTVKANQGLYLLHLDGSKSEYNDTLKERGSIRRDGDSSL